MFFWGLIGTIRNLWETTGWGIYPACQVLSGLPVEYNGKYWPLRVGLRKLRACQSAGENANQNIFHFLSLISKGIAFTTGSMLTFFQVAEANGSYVRSWVFGQVSD